jgi:hypothetical protein
MTMKKLLCIFLLTSLCLVASAKKQPAEQAIVSWYEGPVVDYYGGGCAYHPDSRHHKIIGFARCYRNLVVLKQGDKYLTMDDHCANLWKFKEGETVEFQRDEKYPRKIYLNRHVFALTQESSTPNGGQRTAPAVRDNPDSGLGGRNNPGIIPSTETSKKAPLRRDFGLAGRRLGGRWNQRYRDQ